MRGLGFLALLALGSCAPPRPAQPSARLTVVVDGDARVAGDVRRELAQPLALPVTVRVEAAPNAPSDAAAAPDVAAPLAQARQSYIDGRFGACLQSLGGQERITDLFGVGNREAVARVLFWRVACNVGSGSTAEAAATATVFASLGLEVPPDVEAASPEVETAIARAKREVAQKEKVSLRVSADGEPVSVVIDGRAGGCVTPCSLAVAPGEHVVGIEGDGIVADVQRTVVGTTPAETRFVTTPASPELAARQWTARYAHSAIADSSPSMRLLALAERAPRLSLIAIDGGQTVRMRGVLALDGVVGARAERSAPERELVGEAPALLRDLLVRGKVVEPAPRLYQRPLVWVLVGLVAAGAVVGTYFLVKPAGHRTEVY